MRESIFEFLILKAIFVYRNHVLSHHKDIGEENVQMMLQRIRHLQMPKLELNNAVNDVIN